MKKIIRGLKNLKYWFYVIWSNQDNDESDIYEILIHKLKKQIKYFKKHGNSVDNDYLISRMEVSVKIMQRLVGNYYSHSNIAEIASKYPREAKKVRELNKGNYELAQVLHDKATNVLFLVMRQHIQTWWN